MRFFIYFIIELSLLFFIGITNASALTTAGEQRELIAALSGDAPINIDGIPILLNQRFSDSPAIQTTAQYLKSQYAATGITAEISQYNPSEAFPYYFQITNKTYRSYFKHLQPMLQADFDGLCDATLTPDQTQIVLKRLARVGLDQATLCKTTTLDRVELYISTTVDYSTSTTKKMLAARTQLTWPNVVAIIPTSESADKTRPLCVIGAHMDSIARKDGGRGPIISPAAPAPGADDNASGTAAVLTLAREMQDFLRIKTHQPGYQEPDCDLAFVHFSGEEEGLLGSIIFTRIQEHRPIKWMVNFDMIAYNNTPNTPALNVGYDKLYGSTLPEGFRVPGIKTVTVERNAFTYSSDQIAFWDLGVPAISISEQACTDENCSELFKYFNPNLHTSEDVISNLDFEYDAAIVNQAFTGLVQTLFGKQLRV